MVLLGVSLAVYAAPRLADADAHFVFSCWSFSQHVYKTCESVRTAKCVCVRMCMWDEFPLDRQVCNHSDVSCLVLWQITSAGIKTLWASLNREREVSHVQSGKIPIQKDDPRRLNLKVSIHLGENSFIYFYKLKDRLYFFQYVTLIALILQLIGRVNGRCNLFYTWCEKISSECSSNVRPFSDCRKINKSQIRSLKTPST